MPFVLYLFCKRKWDSLLFTFPWGQGRQSAHQLIPVHPLYNPMALGPPFAPQERDLQSKSVFPPSYCMEPGWPKNCEILIIRILICSSFESPREGGDSFWLSVQNLARIKKCVLQLSTPGGNRAQLFPVTVSPNIFYQSLSHLPHIGDCSWFTSLNLHSYL